MMAVRGSGKNPCAATATTVAAETNNVESAARAGKAGRGLMIPALRVSGNAR